MPPPPLCSNNDGNMTENAKEDADGWMDVSVIPSNKFTSGEGGSAREGWTFANLLRWFKNVAFRFLDGHGKMVTLSTYSQYITNPEGRTDNSPLGIYDSMFGNKCLLKCVCKLTNECRLQSRYDGLHTPISTRGSIIFGPF
jgi:hypothetical protein